jgi:diacylglycerol kinase (ATP)
VSLPRTAVIVNPRAGGGRAGRRWPALAGHAAAALGPFTTRYTRAPGDGTVIARELLAEGFERIVVAGGDGSLGEAANGFMQAPSDRRASACLGLLPLGSGGDSARSLGIPRDPRAAARALAAAVPTPCDLWLAGYRDSAGAPAQRYFLNMASFGIGGEVARRSNGFGGYLGAAALALARHRGDEVELSLDGGPPMVFRIAHVAVGNGAWQGAGMHVCPGARLDDGLLEITVVEDVSLFVLLRNFRMLYSGTIASHPRVKRFRASRLAARGQAPLEADGEPLGFLPLDIEARPRAIRLLAYSSATSPAGTK